jgi:HAD superfamily hydrolase (TIGR01490 family)
MKTIAALFDCDGTLYSAQFGRGLLQYTSEHQRKGAVRSYYTVILLPYLINKFGLSTDEKYLRPLIANLARLIRGTSEQEAEDIFEWVVHQYLLPTQRPDVVARLNEHQSQRHKVVLVSGVFVPVLERLAQAFGVDGFVGTQIEVRNGHYTGQIIPPVITGNDKNHYTRDFFSFHSMDVDWDASYAYADSITDQRLFDLVGNPVAVYPDAKLQSLAKTKGWDILGTPKS